MLDKVEHIFEWHRGGTTVEIFGDFNLWNGEKMKKMTM